MTKQRVLITGASAGLGLEMAVLLAKKGCQVFASMRDLSRKGNLEKRLAAEGASVTYVQCDVTSPESADRCYAEIVKTAGGLDVLINNAGYGFYCPVEEAPMENIRKQMETNFFGLVSMCQKVLPIMRKQGSGKIINISSVAGRVAFPVMSFYNASKYAVEGFSEGLAHEVRQFGIFVSLIEPGRFVTEFSSRGMDRRELPKTSPWYRLNQRMVFELGSVSVQGAPPHRVANLAWRIVQSCSPGTRYVVGKDGHALLILKALLPDRFYRWIMQLVILR